MAANYWHDVTLLFGMVEVAAQGRSFEMAASCVPLDTTAVSTTGWRTFIAGNKTVTTDIDIMADFTSTVTAGADTYSKERFLFAEPFEAWSSPAQASRPNSIVLGSAVGSTAYLGDAVVTSYTPLTGEAGGLAMGHVTAVNTGRVARGALAHSGAAAVSASSTGTAIQLGSVLSTQRLYAALHVLESTGSGDQLITVKVQSDNAQGFGSATDRITFSTLAGQYAEFSSVAGAVTDDWWRVSWAQSGIGSETFRFAVTFGIA